MKKVLTIGAFVSIAAISTAYAQSTTEQDLSVQQPQGAATQTAGEQGQNEPGLGEIQQIPFVVIKDNTNDSVEARIADLKSAASDIGIHQMVVTGSKTETELPDGTMDLEIVWDRAYRITDEGDRKDTFINIPLESSINIPDNYDLSDGAQFNAEGSAIELMAAWERLKTDEEIEEDEELAEDVAAENDAGGAMSAGSESEPLDFEGPEFAEDVDPVIEVTSEGCSVRVDIEQMVAIVQERTLEDGTEVQPCTDTLTRYPLEKAYSGCSLSFDTAEEQYKLNYTDPTAGQIQVQDCTDDDDKIIQLSETTEGCGVFHDFAQEKSYQQSKLTYFYQGANQTLQDCQNTETEYPHEVTRSGCDPVITEDTVTYQDRVRIDVNGSYQYISDCTPDPSTTMNILAEACASPRYTHDFDGGQSFLNQNYYYMDGSEKTYVARCKQSTTSFAHKLDESVCEAQNDDTTKKTTMFARPYIEETAGNQTFIGNCQPVAPSIDYVNIADVWKQNSSTVSSLMLSSTDSAVVAVQGKSLTLRSYDYYWDAAYYYGNGAHCTRKTDMPTYNKRLCVGYTNVSFSAPKYCLRGAIAGEWTAQSGVTISKEHSTSLPTWNMDFEGVNYNGMKFMNNQSGTVIPKRFSCTAPQCQLTHLKAHPLYQRGDGTEFVDTSITTQSLYVCGDGSNLDGQVVQ